MRSRNITARESTYLVALEPDHLGVRVQRYIRKRSNPIDGIARHRGFRALPAHHEVQMLYLRREEHDGLSRRIAATDQRDFLAVAELRLDRVAQ